MYTLILIVCFIPSGIRAGDIDFCSGTRLAETFDPSLGDDTLSIDGSGDATNFALFKEGWDACTCTVTAEADIDRLVVKLVTDDSVNDCGKRIEIIKPEDTASFKLGCSSEKIEIIKVIAGSEVALTLSTSTTSSPVSVGGTYRLDFEHDPSKVTLTVKCYLPHRTTTPTFVTPMTTTPVFVTPSVSDGPLILTQNATANVAIPASKNTLVLVGVLVGLGVVFVVFIICILLVINRRTKLQQKQEKQPTGTTPGLPVQFYQSVCRTASRVYYSIKDKRPLPRIPKSFRNLRRVKSLDTRESGVYDSIRSVKGSVLKTVTGKTPVSNQVSYNVPSHPVTPLNMAMHIINKQCSTEYLSPIPSSAETMTPDIPHVNNLKQSMVTTNEPNSFEKTKNVPPCNDVPDIDYMNGKVKQCKSNQIVIGHDSDKENQTCYILMSMPKDDDYVNIMAANKHTVEQSDSCPYLKMDGSIGSTCDDTDIVSNGIVSGITGEKGRTISDDIRGERSSARTDRTDYLPMDGTLQRTLKSAKDSLKDKDTFGDLLEYTPSSNDQRELALKRIVELPQENKNSVNLTNPPATKPKPRKFVRQANFHTNS